MNEVSFVCIPYSIQLVTRHSPDGPEIGHAIANLITFFISAPNELKSNVSSSFKNEKKVSSNIFTRFPKNLLGRIFQKKNISEKCILDTSYHAVLSVSFHNSIITERVYLQ